MEEMNENEKLEREVEGKLAYLLAKVYVKIPWKKIGVKSAHTFFIERVREASGAMNVKQFLEAVEKNVEVSMVQIDTSIIEFLEENRPYALNVLRKETNYIVILALEQVEKLREQRNLEEKGQATLGGK